MNGARNIPPSMPWPSITAYMALLPEPLLSAPKDFFAYTVDFGTGGNGVNLAASAVAQLASVQVQDDSAFLIVAGYRIYATTADAAVSGDFAPALISVVDSGSGRNLIGGGQAGAFAHIEGLFGVAKNPSYWPYPKILKPNATVQVFLTNLEATARRYSIGFVGFKIFRHAGVDATAFATVPGGF